MTFSKQIRKGIRLSAPGAFSIINDMYKKYRNYENIEKFKFTGCGKYEIPKIYGIKDVNISQFIPFNYVKSSKASEDKGVHFYIDDYQFNRIWTNIDKYTGILKKYGCILSPDFSIYNDFPTAIQIYNHYRKHYVGAYLQVNGATVIPTICWGDKETYEWCFDGEPIESVVSVSSVGCIKNQQYKKMFLDGYKEMISRLHPVKIIFYGDIPDECTGNIVQIKKFTDKFKEATCSGW